MSSIDRNQRKDNYEALGGTEAVSKIREMVEQAENCFFCSTVALGESNGDRPMNVRQVDAEGILWFLSANDSHKNQELAVNPSVKLYFQGSKHSDFMQINGEASISRDRGKIEELWSPLVETWFTEGKDDPRVTVIKVTPTDGYYGDTKHGTGIADVKMLIGAMLKRTMDDSIQGTLDV